MNIHRFLERGCEEKCRAAANQLGIKLMIDGPRRVKIFALLQALQGKPRQRNGFFNPRGLFTHSAHADAQKSVAF